MRDDEGLEQVRANRTAHCSAITMQHTVDFIVGQMAEAGQVTARSMFGDYGLYLDGRLFGLICDDQLFLKPTPAGRARAGTLAIGAPYPGAKLCLQVTRDRWDDATWLAKLVRSTVDALPEK